MRIFVFVSMHGYIILYKSFLYDTVVFCILSYYTTIILILVYGVKVFYIVLYYIVSCYVILHDYITCARCWDSQGSDYGPCKLLDFELERTGKETKGGNQVVT